MYRALILFLFLSCTSGGDKALSVSGPEEPTRRQADLVKLRNKAREARQFCKENGYQEDFCLLADMSLHSGVNRFFLWDLKGDTAIESCLVGHGCCDRPWGKTTTAAKAGLSNKEGSHCSSPGKYRVGERGFSNWGIHIKYLLHGLEATNSNALERTIVLHSWEVVSETECYPAGTPEGWGCPTLSDSDMRKVDKQLKTATKPVLFWMFI